MKAVIESVIIGGILIKKGVCVEIDIWQDGHTMEVTVIDVLLEDNEIFINSITNYGSPITHTAEQWSDMLVRKI